MTSHEPDYLHEELVQLLDLQLSTLEKEVFVPLTKSDLSEYERREARIYELFDQFFADRQPPPDTWDPHGERRFVPS